MMAPLDRDSPTVRASDAERRRQVLDKLKERGMKPLPESHPSRLKPGETEIVFINQGLATRRVSDVSPES
jgi:hypothetical protein